MGKLKQFLIDIDAPAYTKACEIEGRILNEIEYEEFCDSMFNEPCCFVSEGYDRT